MTFVGRAAGVGPAAMDQAVSTTLRRVPAAVPAARAFLRYALGVDAQATDAVERLELAVAEACNNAVVHGEGETFTVAIEVAGGRARVTVSDRGPGFTPPPDPAMPPPFATGRRGLPLMQAMVDDVEVASGPHGTTVVLTQSLLDPAAGQELVAGA